VKGDVSFAHGVRHRSCFGGGDLSEPLSNRRVLLDEVALNAPREASHLPRFSQQHGARSLFAVLVSPWPGVAVDECHSIVERAASSFAGKWRRVLIDDLVLQNRR